MNTPTPQAVNIEIEEDAPAPTLEERLALAQKRKAEREAKADAADQARELERLELEEKYEKELGPVGEKFVIVAAAHRGSIVLKLGTNVLFKQFESGTEANQKKGFGGPTGITEETCTQFVKPNVVHPSVKEFLSIVDELPGVLYTCTGMLKALYDGDRAKARGKA